MNDLNFFSIYKTSRGQTKDYRYYINIVYVILVAVIVSTAVYSAIKYVVVSTEIKRISNLYNASEVQTKLKEVNTVNDKLSMLKDYEGKLSEVVKSVNSIDLVHESLLLGISNSIPEEVSLTEMKWEDYELKFKGISSEKPAIAELEHNLKQLPEFKMVHVKEIKCGEAVGDDFTFEISAIVKEAE